MAISSKSLPNSDVSTVTETLANVEQIAVVITFRQTIEKFYNEYQPSKLKWCNFTESDVRRLVYYDIIEESEITMGTQNVWTLKPWVETILEHTSHNFNLSSKQIKEITRYADDITTLSDEFVARDTDLAGRSVGHLHEIGVIEFVTDNRNKHKPTVWTTTDEIDALLEAQEMTT